jgi:4-amino-4-deoxy-L-arabinose transferase-like glycosyltransferase
MASVNNDALAELLIAAILYLLIKWMQQDKNEENGRYPFSIGVLLGLGFLTKGTVYLMAPVVGFALLWRYWKNWPAFIKNGVRLFLPAAILGALWWLRNVVIYGGLDILGKNRHDAVVVGQIRTAEWIEQFGLAETVNRFVQTTFNSFWGQFGWMALPMPLWILRLLVVFTAVVIVGLMVAPFIWTKVSKRSLRINIFLLICMLLLLLTTGLHVGYNLTFVQHQGRYLYAALIPIGLAVAVGLGTWALWLQRPFGSRFTLLPSLIPIGLGVALVALNLYALLRFIPLLA